MATASSIITDALVEIGAYAPGQPLSNDDAQLALLRFQNQLDAWAADQLTLNVFDRVSYTVPSGVNTFTVGPTGDLVRQRPVWIQGVNYVNPGSSPAVEVSMGPMDDDSYLNLSIKGLTSSLPTEYYYNETMPNGTVFIWPTPTQDIQLYLYLPTAITAPVTLNSTVTGPPGYAEAFMYQLALRLCGPFARPVPQTLPQLASSAYSRMKSPNVHPGVMGVDAALVPSFGGGFNILTGNYTGPSNRF